MKKIWTGRYKTESNYLHKYILFEYLEHNLTYTEISAEINLDFL